MPGTSRFLGPRGRRRRSVSSPRLRGTPGKATGQAAAQPHHTAPRPTLPQSRRPLRASAAAPPLPRRSSGARPAPPPVLAAARWPDPTRTHRARRTRAASAGPEATPAPPSSRAGARGEGGVKSSASAARDRAAGWAEAARDPPHHHAASRRGWLANGAAATFSRAPPRPAPPGLPRSRGCRD